MLLAVICNSVNCQGWLLRVLLCCLLAICVAGPDAHVISRASSVPCMYSPFCSLLPVLKIVSPISGSVFPHGHKLSVSFSVENGTQCEGKTFVVAIGVDSHLAATSSLTIPPSSPERIPIMSFNTFGRFHTGDHTTYVSLYSESGIFLVASEVSKFKVLPLADVDTSVPTNFVSSAELLRVSSTSKLSIASILDKQLARLQREPTSRHSLLAAAWLLQALGEHADAASTFRLGLELGGAGDSDQVDGGGGGAGGSVGRALCHGFLRSSLYMRASNVSNRMGRGTLESLYLSLFIPIPLARQHVSPIESDVAFVVVTGGSQASRKVQSLQQSWLSGLTNTFYFGDQENGKLGIRVPGTDSDWLDSVVRKGDYLSSLPKFFLALREAVLRSSDVSWYYIAGDDTYVRVDGMLDILHGLDPGDKMVVGGHEGVHLGSVFLSGGGGHIFSRALAVKLADAAESFVKEWLGGLGVARMCLPCADVAFAVLTQRLGGVQRSVDGFYSFWPEYYSTLPGGPLDNAWHMCSQMDAPSRFDKRIVRISDRPVAFHYLSPRGMLNVHLFFTVPRQRLEKGAEQLGFPNQKARCQISTSCVKQCIERSSDYRQMLYCSLDTCKCGSK